MTAAMLNRYQTTTHRNPKLEGVPGCINRMLLGSDGSMTRHLSLLTESLVSVEIVSVAHHDEHTERVAWLVDARGRRLVYATSRWDPRRYLQLRIDGEPIGSTLDRHGRSVRRRIRQIVGVESSALREGFGVPEDGELLYGREYDLHVDGPYAATITEILSPILSP